MYEESVKQLLSVSMEESKGDHIRKTMYRNMTIFLLERDL
jgi:hypothetical protein